MNFATGASHAVERDAKLVAHGALMFIAWGVMIPMGIIMARFTKHIPAEQVCAIVDSDALAWSRCYYHCAVYHDVHHNGSQRLKSVYYGDTYTHNIVLPLSVSRRPSAVTVQHHSLL